MKLKSYFTNSIQDALEKARIELGPDAVLISSNRTGSDLKDLGSYEVVFGVPQPNTQRSPADSRLTSAQGPSAATDPVLRELAELRKQIESVGQSMTRSALTRTTEQLRPELAHSLSHLINSGFSSEFAHEVIEAVSLRTQFPKERSHRMIRDHRELFARDLLNAAVEEEIASRFDVQSSLGPQSDEATPVMFVGPPGSGKTSSLIKLGLRCGLKEKRPVHLLSLDTLRIGGSEQLNTYARITGIGFQALADSSILPGAISSTPDKRWTLIDTPGFSAAEEDQLEDLARLVRDLPIEVHLVIPAYVSLAIAQRIFQRFAKLRPGKLLITHVDAVEGTAGLIELAAKSGLPVSFFGTGQQVPEDIKQASKAALLEGLGPKELSISMAA
jgi:flagellar biosynthesis protein FlhF